MMHANSENILRPTLKLTGESWSRSQTVRKSNIIKSPSNRTTMLRYSHNDNNNNNYYNNICMHLRLFPYIPHILVAPRRTSSQTGAFATVPNTLFQQHILHRS